MGSKRAPLILPQRHKTRYYYARGIEFPETRPLIFGLFDTKQEAALAYDTEAKQCGEDKPLNCE
jgi:hypothetical protein